MGHIDPVSEVNKKLDTVIVNGEYCLICIKKIYWESKGYGVETEMAASTANSGLKHCDMPVETVYYDEVKGVTILDAFSILLDMLRWRIKI